LNHSLLTISDITKKLKNKEISVIEIVKSYLQKIEKLNKTINAYITVCNIDAEKYSRVLQEKLNSGEKLPVLFGIPMALNDNIVTRNTLTTCASKMLGNFIPPYNSTVNERLHDSGAILLGKLNMDEFAMGNSNESSYFGAVKNPWDFDRVPGGASGGAAAAVASGLACFALGSDTGGDIRHPSSFCGVVGLKPTYGLVSRYGLVACASSMDQIGPITRNVEDCAVVLNAITGYDPKDSTSAVIKYPDYTAFLGEDIGGLKIGIPKEYLDKGDNGEVNQRVFDACKIFKSLGAEIVEVSLPTTQYAIPAYYIISSAEISSNLARYDGIKYGYRAKDCQDIEDLYQQSRLKVLVAM
jgi:aspartyl-tRNA(Asn)/glutamyl-tRNA(Gln) amidotransferase subunit A